ncbi:MAG: TraR/DksA family transcriptional regulator [Flavobacteriaceae bacterium]|nr:TraR/DksA C4-type zinc finger protein [Bacteroidia bacterium]NND10322.1 TraR/DksA family transcriptional regulator [Flavobacteriaceae bacterium]NNK28017.1 TraR/DksA family transcriptional regulator [Flavobacteriaceae bacterium]NNL60120.1 TraR/DksA family transcriptional regulator [Flavobacteriaceae bacterium]RZV61279.1 MAG: TraR/DksA family transcriptional regulator [Flavobacteriaceae bacterium]
MTPKEKKDINKIMLEEIELTKKSIEKYRELTKPIAPENAIGRVSRMDAINNKSVNDAALKKAEQKLKNLKIALGNLDNDDFGICAKCHNPIPLGRILLVPQNRFCVNCAV